jgi:glycosyltransferase involved in cell wall biosynthesis
MAMKTLLILGTRGIPAEHGGFETFAERLSLYLVSKGWRVIVYCQESGSGDTYISKWNGVDRVCIPVKYTGSFGSIVFDWMSILHALRLNSLCLTLGYNTAIFSLLLRLKGVVNIFNMDGIEWRRAKWGFVAKFWFWFNDWAGCLIGNHLIADHPGIKLHLTSRVSPDKITTIAYGADEVTSAAVFPVESFGLISGRFITVIARAEPENSLLEIVKGFSAKPRGLHLVVLGNYSDTNAYHRSVKNAAGPEVKFLGAIYDKLVVQALRFHSAAYVHGHQVGGTNPSLVEALGAGNAVIAHDNRFNRWVAGDAALYFRDADSFSTCMDRVQLESEVLAELQTYARKRFVKDFTWNKVLGQYEDLLTSFLPK